jgi:enoyl-CoA hydratase
LFTEVAGKEGNLGLITLNRPAVLNSLNHAMVHAMHAQLKDWAAATHIKAVVIRAAEGRAFCAGGDLRLTYDRIKARDPMMIEFFRDEYQLNRAIFHFPKPYIALLDGITMGGGVGISIHGSHRVATERLMFAMPETGIGFFPDVGGTYFLPRLPGSLGTYLGLTGARLGSDDCVAIGLAQVKVAQQSLTELLDALAECKFGHDARQSVTDTLARFRLDLAPSKLMNEKSEIDKCFSQNTVEQLIEQLQHSTGSFCKDALSILAKKSPTSLKVTLHAMQQHLDLDACMRQEYRLVSRFLQGHDFAEGIRAVIIDKDQKPHWQPDTITGVKESEVEKYFAPLQEELA